MLDWNLVVWRRGGGGRWWWWCHVFDAKNFATHYPCLFSSVLLEEEDEVKLLMPNFFKEKLKLLPIFVVSLKSFSQFLVQTPLNLEKTAPPPSSPFLSKVLWEVFNFGFSIPSPKSKPQRYTHPSSPIPIKSLWKEVFEFGGTRVQNCPDLQLLRERERERETHTHTHTQAQKVPVPILEQWWVK